MVEDLTTADWSGFAALVLSPGAPLTHPKPHWTVDRARDAGVPVIGDVELFARALEALPQGRRPKVVAITGTNGKSTTTALIGWVLQQAGLTVYVGGNIGIGVLALPEPTPGAVYVIEVSSYQLDLTTRFAPDVAILTNVSPDHLDRHGGMEGYVAAKRRIFQAQGPEAVALVGVDEEWGQGIVRDLASRVLTISSAHPGASRDPVLSSGRNRGAINLDRVGRRDPRRPVRRPLAARPPQRPERRLRLCRRPRPGRVARGRRQRPADLPRPGPPDGGRRPYRPGPLHQRLQGHQRRRRASGPVRLSQGLLDRRRQAQGRRHR